MYKKVYHLLILLLSIFLIGCGAEQGQEQDKVSEVEKMNADTYECISQEEAQRLMKTESDYIILDVRTIEEYNGGHIVDAICIPNEEVEAVAPQELPDKEQLILVYCRSGNRSKQASKKLAEMGYTNIKEFGGINTWTGDIIKEYE